MRFIISGVVNYFINRHKFNKYPGKLSNQYLSNFDLV
jgi:hypothetical protein